MFVPGTGDLLMTLTGEPSRRSECFIVCNTILKEAINPFHNLKQFTSSFAFASLFHMVKDSLNLGKRLHKLPLCPVLRVVSKSSYPYYPKCIKEIICIAMKFTKETWQLVFPRTFYYNQVVMKFMNDQ